MSSEADGKCCFNWKIDNYSLCPQENGEPLWSPYFTAENVGNSIWCIWLYPKGKNGNSKEYVSLAVIRDTDDNIDDVNNVDVVIEIVEPDGVIIKQIEMEDGIFNRGTIRGVQKFIKIQKLAQIMEKWKEDTLILCCTIANRKELYCKAQTKIEADRWAFKWYVATQDDVIHPMQKEFSMRDASIFVVNLIPSDEGIKLSICTKDIHMNFPKTISCRISLLDIYGDEVYSKRAVHVYESEESNGVWEFPTFFSVKHLEDNKSRIVINGIFTLLFAFSSLKNRDPINVINPICNNYSKQLSIFSLKYDLLDMYCDKLHSDIELIVEGKTFHAHKCILAARSDVFSAMFSQDMLESKTGIINISDVDADQFESFLKYLYSGEVDNMNYETASELMVIADKYQVNDLSIHCSYVLRLHLCKTNVYEIFTLADMVNYKPLKVFAFDFIVEHEKEIFTSVEWVKWTESNVKLAAELMSSIVANSEMVPKKFKKQSNTKPKYNLSHNLSAISSETTNHSNPYRSFNKYENRQQRRNQNVYKFSENNTSSCNSRYSKNLAGQDVPRTQVPPGNSLQEQFYSKDKRMDQRNKILNDFRNPRHQNAHQQQGAINRNASWRNDSANSSKKFSEVSNFYANSRTSTDRPYGNDHSNVKDLSQRISSINLHSYNYSNEGTVEIPSKPFIKPGAEVLAKYWEDSKFYHAKVTGVAPGGKTCFVFFTDYGNYEEVAVDDVQEMQVQSNI